MRERGQRSERSDLEADGLNGFHPVRTLTLPQPPPQTAVVASDQVVLLQGDLLQLGLCLVQTGSELVLLCQQGVPVQRGQRVWGKEVSRVFSSLLTACSS